MSRRLLAALWLLLAGSAWAGADGWRLALPGWDYEFPRDHGNHPEFKTEWWYFTGNVATAEGREFGYQLTFFRQGVRPENVIPLSRFVTRDIKFAHFAVSDIGERKFSFFQKLSRGAYGEAGFDQGQRVAWIEDWYCDRIGENVFRLHAQKDGVELTLDLNATKPPVVHGADGVSQKAEGAGRASHYYSLTRLVTSGTLRVDGKSHAVSGSSWFDHEWATNQLGADQLGWDWFSLQLADGSELMLFQLRLKAGGRDRHSGGTFIDPSGVTTTLTDTDFSLDPVDFWKSPRSGAPYPIRWRIEIPRISLRAEVRAANDNQELGFDSVTYWEGAVRAEGSLGSSPVKGTGYLEMTGYAGAITGLQSSP